MGNTFSQQSKTKKSLEHIINYVASKYIRTQNFNDMKNLSDPKYCDKLVILTSKIIKEYLDNTTIKYLAAKKGIMGDKILKENVLAINKDDLDRLDVKNFSKKLHMCTGLAKHYIQVATLFASIAGTLNPIYNYTDESGNKLTSSLENKDEDVPDNVDTKITRNNLCSNRINSLLHNKTFKEIEEQITKTGSFSINPTFCNINSNSDSSVKKLSDEPGIPELKHLYYDKYDYHTGKFDKMTPEMENRYQNDVDEFYKVFTGENNVPENIKNFSDIKLKDYLNSNECQTGEYNNEITGNIRNTIFFNYINNIKKMINNTKKYHDKLLNILDKRDIKGIHHLTGPKISKLQLIQTINDIFELNLNIIPKTEPYVSRLLKDDLNDSNKLNWVTMISEFKSFIESFESIINT